MPKIHEFFFTWTLLSDHPPATIPTTFGADLALHLIAVGIKRRGEYTREPHDIIQNKNPTVEWRGSEQKPKYVRAEWRDSEQKPKYPIAKRRGSERKSEYLIAEWRDSEQKLKYPIAE